MPNYRVQYTIETADSNAANFATNTLYASADGLVDLAGFTTQMDIFYNAVDVYFSPLVKAVNGLKYKIYDMADPEPRAPKTSGSTSLTLGAGDALPPEIALCVSYQGTQVSGTSQARRRGRFYLPFFGENNAAGDGRPATAMVTAIVAAADALLTASKASSTWKWKVYSPTSGAFIDVDNGWVDNEWDVQRRRGRIMTTRSTFS